MNYNENVCLFLILEVYWNIGDETILFIRKDFPFVSTTVAQRWNQCTSLPKLSNVIPSLSSAFGHMLTLEAFQYLAFKNSKNRSFCKSNILKKKKSTRISSLRRVTSRCSTYFLLISSCMRLPCWTAIEYGLSANVSPTSVRLQLL